MACVEQYVLHCQLRLRSSMRSPERVYQSCFSSSGTLSNNPCRAYSEYELVNHLADIGIQGRSEDYNTLNLEVALILLPKNPSFFAPLNETRDRHLSRMPLCLCKSEISVRHAERAEFSIVL